MRAIHRKLLGLLEAQGIKPFDSLGQTFNPELHEAIASVPSDSHQPGEIVDEVQRGYRWGDQVLRPARVRVAT
jgi:molecular chaperone GrpE